MTLLRTRELSVDFGGLRAINRLSLEVRAGEIRGIIGPNGAGKTTLFNLITRVYSPTEGSIEFNGQDLMKLPAHRVAQVGIARTFQNIELFGSLTVVENVMVGMHRHLGTGLLAACALTGRARREEREARAKAMEILGFVGLDQLAERPATHLSFGQMRLLEVARALAADPIMILLDEPAAGIHPNRIAELDGLLVRLRDERGLTILIVEHVLKLVFSISDRITVLNQGAKIAEGTPAEIKENPRVVDVYFGDEAPT